MTRSRNVRKYRACQRCRRRKLKCEQDDTVPEDNQTCLECHRAREKCLPADSRRGGNYVHFRTSKASQPTLASSSQTPSPVTNHHMDSMESTARMPAAVYDTEQTSHSSPSDPSSRHFDPPSSHFDPPIYTELTNPCNALQILGRVTTSDQLNSSQDGGSVGAANTPSSIYSNGDLGNGTPRYPISSFMQNQRVSLSSEWSESEFLVNHVLSLPLAIQLLEHYAENYHPFSPLASKKVLNPLNIRVTATEEPLLLVAILTISSKDDNKFWDVHQQCWRSLKRQMLNLLLADPSTLQVGSVEGLLLLAEWVPYGIHEVDSSAGIEHRNLSTFEDNMAWSLIGQAVRHAYLLRLDLASFREKVPGESQELEDRKRLAWMFVYIADRQISVRMGQSFWSRGPSLSSRFTADDFPSLQLLADAQHSYAFVLQATLELTQLIHNIQDVLYSSKARTAQMMLLGDYNRYLDDFRRSLSTWQANWGNLKASPKLKNTLRIVHEYVRLYVNAFSFQAAVTRAFREASTSKIDRSFCLFPRGIMGSPDGVYVFEAINAARNILTIVTETDPTVHVRYMPTRFYIYTVYSAVFLHKADVFGAFSTKEEKDEIRNLVYKYILNLEDAATNNSHIGSRYSKLLKALWFPSETESSLQSNRQAGEALNNSQDMNYNTATVAADPTNFQPVRDDGCGNDNYNAPPREMALPIFDESIYLLGNLDPFCPWLMNMNAPLIDMGVDADIGVNTWMNNLFSGLAQQ